MVEFLHKLLPNAWTIPDELWEATLQTLYMVFWSALWSGILGFLLGVILVVARPGGLAENRLIYQVLDKCINIIRAIPFVILLSLLIGFTRFLLGTTIGEKAALVPLIFGIVPFYARQIEVALLEVDPGVIEAAEAMGTSPLGIVFRVYFTEGLPSIVRVSALTMINVIGLTTMAGIIGAGGLGNLAITRGYNRFQTDVTIVATVILLILVFFSQFISNRLVKRISH